MDRFNALGRGTQLMLVGAVLLFIDLFLPWQDFDVGDLGQFSGWRGVGVILGLVTIVLLAWIIVRIAAVDIPLPVSTAMTAALLATLVLIFAIIKMLTILGDETTLWAWIGLVLAVVIAAGGFQTVQEAGGVETLKTEASGMGSSVGTKTAAAPAAAPPEAPAAPPPPPPAAPEPQAAPEPDVTPGEPEEDRPA